MRGPAGASTSRSNRSFPWTRWILGALRDSKERYRTLFELAPLAVYSCDASGVIREYNRRAAELWGRIPAPGDTDERFCGPFKMYRPDGTYMPHEQCPTGDVLSGKLPALRDGEVLIERPDGSRAIVIMNIAPLTDEQGNVTGATRASYSSRSIRASLEQLSRPRLRSCDPLQMPSRSR